jgi:hypothetical protein
LFGRTSYKYLFHQRFFLPMEGGTSTLSIRRKPLTMDKALVPCPPVGVQSWGWEGFLPAWFFFKIVYLYFFFYDPKPLGCSIGPRPGSYGIAQGLTTYVFSQWKQSACLHSPADWHWGVHDNLLWCVAAVGRYTTGPCSVSVAAPNFFFFV